MTTTFNILKGAFLLTVLFFFAGCKKNDTLNVCNGVAAPTITTAAEVTAGETITLSASTIEGAEYYQWTGPANFTSDLQNPTIQNAQTANAGVYKLKVGMDGSCVLESSSDSIRVVSIPAECEPANNTVALSGLSSIQINSSTAAASGGSFVFTATGSGGSASFEFFGTNRPGPGFYDIKPGTGAFAAGDVRVTVTALTSSWSATEGRVHVAINPSNKIVITFCSVPITGQLVGLNTTATGRATEN